MTLATDSVQWGERVEIYGYPASTVVPDQTFDRYKSVTFSPMFLRGYVTQVVPNMDGRPAMNLDMSSPRGLSGAPVLREGSREIVGVVVGDRTIRLGGESFRFSEALLLDALRNVGARLQVTEGWSITSRVEATVAAVPSVRSIATGSPGYPKAALQGLRIGCAPSGPPRWLTALAHHR